MRSPAPWRSVPKLAILDPSAKRFIGGTAYFVEKWRACGRKATIIDLADLRAGMTFARKGLPRAASAGIATWKTAKIRRQIKVMLFADVKNFSMLREEQSPQFFYRFLREGADVLASSDSKVSFSNTWGDGLYLVFHDVVGCAEFAMRLLERIERVRWERMGLPPDTMVRMGIHAGPVYHRLDPIIQQDNFFGSHMNRAARIEPVTAPGCAFASEQFAALLAVEPNHDFVCEYIGMENLAKEYDRCALYRVRRK